MSVFLGWMPQGQAQADIAALQESLRAQLPPDAPRHAWRMPAQWHLTLRFLEDEVKAEQRAALSDALTLAAAGLAPAHTQITRLQYWPSARVLVALLADNPALQTVFARMELLARRCGYPQEKRAPKPHITLAYLTARVATSALPALPAPAPIDLRIDAVQLLRTIPLGYRCWHSAPLGGT